MACGAVKQSLRTFFMDCSSRHFRFGSSKLIVSCGAFKGFVDTLKNCFFQTFPNLTLYKMACGAFKEFSSTSLDCFSRQFRTRSSKNSPASLLKVRFQTFSTLTL
ncbi:hypothetical protein WDU94_003709 [Cyamophila willieti]